MKRYILFQFDTYYPRGGIEDIEGSFDTIAEAKQFVNDNTHYCFSYAVDRDTWEIKWRSEDEEGELR